MGLHRKTWMPRVSKKRRAKMDAEKAQRAARTAPAAAAPAAAPTNTRAVVHSTTARTYAAPIEKRGTIESEAQLELVRARRCAFCGEGPWPLAEREVRVVDPHHVHVIGNRQERFDDTAVPACRGPGTRNCHDLAQRLVIPLERQYEALGEQLCTQQTRISRSEHVTVHTQILQGLG